MLGHCFWLDNYQNNILYLFGPREFSNISTMRNSFYCVGLPLKEPRPFYPHRGVKPLRPKGPEVTQLLWGRVGRGPSFPYPSLDAPRTVVKLPDTCWYEEEFTQDPASSQTAVPPVVSADLCLSAVQASRPGRASQAPSKEGRCSHPAWSLPAALTPCCSGIFCAC